MNVLQVKEILKDQGLTEQSELSHLASIAYIAHLQIPDEYLSDTCTLLEMYTYLHAQSLYYKHMKLSVDTHPFMWGQSHESVQQAWITIASADLEDPLEKQE